jgi:hypothetical protein
MEGEVGQRPGDDSAADPCAPLAQVRRRSATNWPARITCDRCGRDRMFSEAHAAQGDMLIRDILKRMRHDGCGGRPGRVELLTGIEGASSRPVRKIVLVEG